MLLLMCRVRPLFSCCGVISRYIKNDTSSFKLRTYSKGPTILKDSNKTGYFGDQNDDLDIHLPSMLIKMKSRFVTSSFSLYDAEVVQDGEDFFKSRTIMKITKVGNIQDLYKNIFMIRSLPNLAGAWRPIDLLVEYNRVFVIYDACFHTTLTAYIQQNVDDLVIEYKFRHFNPTTVRLLRMLVDFAMCLEEHQLYKCLNENLIFTNGTPVSIQILVDFSTDINNYDVIANIIETYFMWGKSSNSVVDLVDMLRKGNIKRSTINNIVALSTTGSIIRRLSAVVEAFKSPLHPNFQRDFDVQNWRFNGWKFCHPWNNYDQTPSSLVKYIRNMCLRKGNNYFYKWETWQVILYFEDKHPSILQSIFDAFISEGLIE